MTSPASGTVGQPGYTPSYTTQYTYGLTQTTEARGVGASGALTTTYTLDAQGEPITVTDGLGHSTATSYDQDHDPVSRTDADGHATTYGYHYVGPTGSVGLITQTVQPAIQPDSPLTPVSATVVTTRSYAPQTYDLVEIDQPAGGITRYAYDGHHAISATAELTTTSPISLWRGTVERYDPYGEQIATTDGRGVTVNANGNATLADPWGLYTSHTGYDAQGDQVSASTPPITRRGLL